MNTTLEDEETNLIESVSYFIQEVHGRFHVEKRLNGYYDCFTRVKLDTMSSIFGDEFGPTPAATPTWTLTATPKDGPNSWKLTTHHVYDGDSTISVSEEQVRELLKRNSVVDHSYVYPGDVVATNYQYHEEFRKANG